jgi:hypothetical protein
MAAFTYPRSEPGSGGHMDLVERLNAHTGELRALVANVPDATLSRRTGDGQWSIKDTAGHLCDVSRVLHSRLHKMIKLEEPQLDGYDPDELAAQRNAQGARIDDLLAEFAAQRAETVEMLADLVHWNWARTGRHPQLGRLSIRQQVELWLEHEDEHLASIREAAGAN